MFIQGSTIRRLESCCRWSLNVGANVRKKNDNPLQRTHLPSRSSPSRTPLVSMLPLCPLHLSGLFVAVPFFWNRAGQHGNQTHLVILLVCFVWVYTILRGTKIVPTAHALSRGLGNGHRHRLTLALSPASYLTTLPP